MISRKAVSIGAASTVLYFAVIGVQSGLLLIGSIASFLTGSLLVCLYYGKVQSDATYGQTKVPLAPSSVGIPKVISMMEACETKEVKLDQRLTGASNIDEQLQEVLKYVFRDYIEIWYKKISDDTAFLVELRRVFNSVISNFASRAKAIDWTPLLTHKLVDEMASHVKLYRRACQKSESVKADKDSDKSDDTLDKEAIEEYFFEFEMDMEHKICRQGVSSSEEHEKEYLQELAEMLLYFLLPDDEFDQRMFRFLIREVLVHGIIHPTIDKMAEPDYINQNIIWMCSDSTLTSESFMTTLKMSSSIEELQSVLAKVNEDISRARAKDTGGVDDSSIKQTLRSLSYLSRVCESQITRVATKSSSGLDSVDSLDVPTDVALRVSSNKNLPLVFVLANELGVQYFNDYLICIEREIYLNIILDIECFNKELSLQQKSCADPKDLQTFFTEMAGGIHDKYFAEPVSYLHVDPSCVEPILRSLKEGKVNSSVFDQLYDVIMEKLEKFYEDFKRHDLYQRMLRELDLDVGCSLSEDSYDIAGPADEPDEDTSKPESKVTAVIVKTGTMRDREGGSTYGVYNIEVVETTTATRAVRKWQTLRRYSDFYDLYITLSDKYAPLRDLHFPGKRTFNNLGKEFLEKRAISLSQYMQMVLSSESYDTHASLRKIMADFLHTDSWEKPKGSAHGKVGTMLHPLKQSVKHMGTKFKAVPGDFIDGFGKMFTKLSLAPNLGKNQLDSYKVGASLDTEDDDNIPMRIMLLLLDEVFDLRKKNQWLRRRVVAILRQVVKATYGDRINRRIVEHVEMLTSADQVAEYIKQMKDRLWPSGVPAEPSSARDTDTQLRTGVVCKAKMIGSVPDELRHLIGTETTRSGLLRVFTMFQHKHLNKRLIYVMIECVLQTLFPHNQLDLAFRRIHLKSQRNRANSSLSTSSTS